MWRSASRTWATAIVTRSPTRRSPADAALVRMLAARYPLSHLIGHSESKQMKPHPYWRERDPRYQNDKPDPGEAFLAQVRARVVDLGLSGPPGP